MTITGRVGVFCVVIGIALIALYLASDAVRQTQCGYLAWGMALIIVGIALWRKGSPPHEPAPRFGAIKRILTSSAQRNKGKRRR